MAVFKEGGEFAQAGLAGEVEEGNWRCAWFAVGELEQAACNPGGGGEIGGTAEEKEVAIEAAVKAGNRLDKFLGRPALRRSVFGACVETDDRPLMAGGQIELGGGQRDFVG